MNSFIVKLLFAAATQLPKITGDFQKAIADAQSSADGQAKLKALIQDAVDFLTDVLKAL